VNKSTAIAKIRTVIQRISDGAFNDSDIEMLFIKLRELPSATKYISEVGDFVAHNHLRDKGLVNDMMLRNHYLLSMTHGVDQELLNSQENKYPKYLPELIRLQLKAFDDAHLKERFGLKGGQVRRIRDNLVNKKSYVVENNICSITEKLSNKSRPIASYLLSSMTNADAIKYDDLVENLKEVLAKELAGIDLSIVDSNRLAVFCVLLCLMHNTNYKLPNENSAKIAIYIEKDRIVNVYGHFPVKVRTGGERIVTVVSPVLVSTFLYDDVFDGSVRSEDLDEGNIVYSSEQRKIVRAGK
jgi:hypothetical protein